MCRSIKRRQGGIKIRVIYVTDLHGSWWKYEKLLKMAEDQGIDAVINGGDVMPMEGGLQKQGQFISRFLDDYFSRFNSKKIY